ncbi:AraC family transcriptional regulator [Pseudomonas sp. LS1212]|uniref:helix-turn-helix domain-containing protein n=1 Tax=Pseudomonas sp. LS1212 TaxID=2972478 RepID=UPI00215CF479|nr:AraC family transcriptional regulator [Pseudomonas sp. LS1212]UVJ42109.1 AraC family transcriptional regulator [Pseudomonas sp. LS1212]
MVSRPAHAVRVPYGLDTRLLDELHRNSLQAPGQDGLAEQLSADSFVALYRQAIEQLEEKVAQGEGQPPMRKYEVDLMCRCLLSCGTLGEAIHCAAEFCAMLHPRAGKLSLELHGQSATFHMDSLRQRRSSAACLVDLTGLFCYLQLFAWLIGQTLRPSNVFLAHPERKDAMPFLGLFDAPVSVGKATYGFSFGAELLARQVVRKPAELAVFLVDFPFRLIGAPPNVVSATQQVRSFLDAALAHELELPALGSIAEALGTSEPTLRRRLAAEGSSYQQLRRLCLCESAQRCLRDSDWTIGRVAGHLGFSSEAAFRRAFVSWTGHAPSHFRIKGD